MAAALPKFEVRRSRVHGQGVFALRRIRKGTRLIEYLGQRVSHKEADRRYQDKDERDNHTFLFTVDGRTVIDAGVDGNEARFFNHSCNPNCESVIEDRRVWIEAIRTIEPGEEMTYDYQITRDDDDPPDIDQIFACRCGAAHCRGTMLWSKAEQKAKERAQARQERQAQLARQQRQKKKAAARRAARRASSPSRVAARGTGRAAVSAPAARRKAARR
jgi:uncharacterized protein